MIAHACLVHTPAEHLSVAGKNVYHSTDAGAVCCTFDSVFSSAEELVPRLAALSAPALIVLKGPRATPLADEVCKVVLSSLWREISSQREAWVGLKGVFQGSVSDLLNNQLLSSPSADVLQQMRDFSSVQKLASSYLHSAPAGSHLIAEFSSRPAFMTGQHSATVSVVCVDCPAGVPARDLQLLECALRRLSLAELARGVKHIPYSFDPLVSSLSSSILGEKLLVTVLPGSSIAQSLWLLESTGQMNSSMLCLKPGSRRLMRAHLASRVQAVDNLLKESVGDRRRLASANADLCSLYRDLTKPSEYVTPVPRPPTVRHCSRKVQSLLKREELDLANCVLVTGKKRGARVVIRGKR